MWSIKPNLRSRFDYLLETCERYLMKLIISGVLLLIIVQSLLSYDYLTYGWNLTNSNVNLDIEKEVISNLEDDYVTLRLLSYSSLYKAKVIINGETKTNFKKNKISFNVNPGDEVIIDCSFYHSPVKFKVFTSEGIKLPTSNQVIVCSGDKIYLGKIKNRADLNSR